MSSYLEQTLAPDEKAIYTTSLSWYAHLGHLFLGIILLPAFGLGLLVLLPTWVMIHSTELAVTSKRILVKTGFVSRNTIELNLSRLESIQVHQSFLGRLFNYGTVIISGAGAPQAPLEKIKDPLAFRREALAAQDALWAQHKPQQTPFGV